MASQRTDNELMHEFKGCSIAAYNEIVARYKTRLFNYVLRSFLRNSDDSEEVTQKVLIKVYENKFKYRPKYEFTTWVYTIARHLAINEVKRKQMVNIDHSVECIESSSILEALPSLESSERDRILIATLWKLDPLYREVLLMRYVEELSFEEISRITKKNKSTLRSLVRRGLETMRLFLQEAGIEEESL